MVQAMPNSASPPATNAALEAQLSYLVNRLASHGQSRLGAMLKQCGASLIVLRTLSVLHIENGLTINEIAERTFSEQSKTSRTIDAMVLAGLVERHTPGNDLRRREVMLTPAGSDVLFACWPQMEAFHALLVKGICEEDLAVTRRVLLAMTANLRS
jgi:DNA-binding MarR family transcriptional regulator